MRAMGRCTAVALGYRALWWYADRTNHRQTFPKLTCQGERTGNLRSSQVRRRTALGNHAQETRKPQLFPTAHLPGRGPGGLRRGEVRGPAGGACRRAHAAAEGALGRAQLPGRGRLLPHVQLRLEASDLQAQLRRVAPRVLVAVHLGGASAAQVT